MQPTEKLPGGSSQGGLEAAGQASGLLQKLLEAKEACHILEGDDRNGKARRNKNIILQSSETKKLRKSQSREPS